jgi:hypothetical protein
MAGDWASHMMETFDNYLEYNYLILLIFYGNL